MIFISKAVLISKGVVKEVVSTIRVKNKLPDLGGNVPEYKQTLSRDLLEKNWGKPEDHHVGGKLVDENTPPKANLPPEPLKKLTLKGITEHEIKLAGSPGRTAEQLSACEKLIKEFLNETDSTSSLPNLIGEHGGVNLDMPVKIVEIPPGKKVTQWVKDGQNLVIGWILLAINIQRPWA